MDRNFLSNFKVGEAVLPDVVIDAIMAENQRDLESAKANPGASGESGGKTFTQEEVNRIISDRLAREKSKTEPPKENEREQALKAREARLDCRDYLDSKKYPAALLDVLDCSDAEKFKAATDALVNKFPHAFKDQPTPPPYASGTGKTQFFNDDPIAGAFKPQT